MLAIARVAKDLKGQTVFQNGVDRSAIGIRHPSQGVILSPSAALRVNSATKDLLLYAAIVLFTAEKQIPRCARNDIALWFTPIVKLL